MKESTGRMILAALLILISQGANLLMTVIFSSVLAFVALAAAFMAMRDDYK